MYIARILYPVKVLGPGNRVGIWFSGCGRRCGGCSNPELWERNEKYRISVDNAARLIEQIAADCQIDGFTLTGGDPFFQCREMTELVGKIARISDDILVYTGYRYEEIKDKIPKEITALIDGEYIEELNDNSFLRGSSNQRIFILQDKYKRRYESYIKTGVNRIQNFSTENGVISVGIHKAGF